MTRPRVSHRVVCWNVQRDRALDRVLGEIRDLSRRADVLLLQETQGYARHLKVPGFRLYAVHGHEKDETCILVRESCHLGKHGVRQVTTHGWLTVRGGKTPPKWCAFAVVDGIEYHSIHTPPTVQLARMHVHSPLRWRAYRELVARLTVHSKAAVVAGDFNLTPHSRFGTWLMRRMAADPRNLRRHAPSHGTHGRRVIDYVFSSGVRIGEMRTLAQRGSDHNPVAFVVTSS